MRLNKEQIDILEKRLSEMGLSHDSLKTELLDEVATTVEIEVEKGLSFDTACENILGEIDSKDINRIQKNMIRVLMSGRNLKRYERRQALILSAGLIIWVLVEYVVGLISGIKELGPTYGALSLIIIFVLLLRSLRHIRARYFEGEATFKSILYSGSKISISSSIIFAGFLILFWTYIFPDFYSTYQLNPEDAVPTHNQFLVGSVLGTGVSSAVIGVLSSIALGAGLKRR